MTRLSAPFHSLVRPRFQSIALGLLLSACGQETVPFKAAPPLEQVGEPSADAKADVVKTFNSGKIIPVDLTIDSGFANLAQGFTLEQKPKQIEQYSQIERAIYTDSFTQGHSGLPAAQSFSVSEAGIFDLLLVIDNSSSMGPYQNLLSTKLPSILKYIQNTNWRIAVVTTSSSCLRKTASGKSFLSKKDYDLNAAQADAEFQDLIKVGETGYPIERGIKMATLGMTESGCESNNVSWLRPDSNRSVLLLTDENNCGSASNEGCAGDPDEKAEYFFDRVGKNVSFNALMLTQEPPSSAGNSGSPFYHCKDSGYWGTPPNPVEYAKLVTETGGLSADICRSDFATVLSQISEDIGKKINVQFELQYPAEVGTLDIKLDGKKLKSYNVNGRYLSILEPVTDKSGILEVKYKHDPEPLVKTFSPTRALDSQTIEVFVNEKSLEAKDFTLNADGKVELRDLPPELASVKVRYRSNATLPKSFSYVSDYYLDSMEVNVDGKATKNFTVDKNSRKVTLETAPRDGQKVILSYELPGDRKTNYPLLGVLVDEIEAFQLVDAQTGEALSAIIEAGQIKIDPLVVKGGRKVVAKYNLAHEFDGKVFVLETPKAPYPDTLKIEAGGTNPELCSKNIKVRGGKLNFECTDEDFGSIRVQYAYPDDYRNTFDIAIDFSGPKTYRVFIGGIETNAYEIINEKLVILKKDLPPDTEVKVIVHPDVI